MNAPSRPTPHWISSKISTAPALSQAFRAASRNATEQSRAPVSPCTGSTITAATSLSTIAVIAAASLKGTLTDSGIPARRAPASYFAPSVTARHAAVRPCHPPATETMVCRPVTFRASPSAFSLASAPELQKNTLDRSPGQRSAMRSASRSRSGWGTAVE